jgi:hypothetical protein
VPLLAIPVKRSDLSNVKHRVRTSSEQIGEVRIAIVTLHSSLPSWVESDNVQNEQMFSGLSSKQTQGDYE